MHRQQRITRIFRPIVQAHVRDNRRRALAIATVDHLVKKTQRVRGLPSVPASQSRIRR